MKFFKFFSALVVLSLFNFSSKAVTLNAIMENVPDTLFIQELLPDFKEKTGSSEVSFGFKYNSGENDEWLTVNEIRTLIVPLCGFRNNAIVCFSKCWSYFR